MFYKSVVFNQSLNFAGDFAFKQNFVSFRKYSHEYVQLNIYFTETLLGEKPRLLSTEYGFSLISDPSLAENLYLMEKKCSH